jgi:hypothetical protein
MGLRNPQNRKKKGGKRSLARGDRKIFEVFFCGLFPRRVVCFSASRRSKERNKKDKSISMGEGWERQRAKKKKKKIRIKDEPSFCANGQSTRIAGNPRSHSSAFGLSAKRQIQKRSRSYEPRLFCASKGHALGSPYTTI